MSILTVYLYGPSAFFGRQVMVIMVFFGIPLSRQVEVSISCGCANSGNP